MMMVRCGFFRHQAAGGRAQLQDGVSAVQRRVQGGPGPDALLVHDGEWTRKFMEFLTANFVLQHSGGIERDWAGFPIQLFDQDSKTFSCVCAKKENFELPQLRPYDNCDDASRSCFVQSDEPSTDDE